MLFSATVSAAAFLLALVAVPNVQATLGDIGIGDLVDEVGDTLEDLGTAKVCVSDIKICPDGSQVLRLLPDCDFEACGGSVSGDPHLEDLDRRIL